MPPPFLALAAHPVRWRLLRELAFGDHQVGELTRLVGQRQSLVSYHLGRLRAGGLVSSRRSSADGRDAYYRADLAGCGASLTEAAAALHPGLQLVSTAGGGVPSITTTARVRVLFLCTGNSARSQMAEALMRHLSDGRVEAVSAGSHPKPLHPNAVRVMRERGIEISGAQTKHLQRFARRRFDCVISLCDRVREVCPEFPGHPDTLHWSMPDPAAGGTSDEATYPAFERAAEELETRIRFLLHHLFPPPVPPTEEVP